METIRLIVGLGNPGIDYASTRHNAGFWFIDQIAAYFRVSLHNENKYFGITGKFSYKNRDVYLLKPQTFMNLSGKSVLALANFYKILPNEILVVHDELDFTPGVVKLKFGGGDGGHNGLRDIERVIGRDYWRLRLGIGHPGDKNKVANYVLKKPSKDDIFSIEIGINKAISVMEVFLSNQLNLALKQLHTV